MPEEIWVLVLSKGTESRLFLADLFNELIDGVEVSWEPYFLLGLAFEILPGLAEQLRDLFIRVIRTRRSGRGCHRNVGALSPASNGLDRKETKRPDKFHKSGNDLHLARGRLRKICNA
jgi:hypothetical protein